MAEHNFKMDERWTLFTKSNSYDEFSKTCIPDLYLKPEVPEDIREMFAFIHRLLSLSYFEWELYDIASLKSLQTFEAAMRQRYKEVMGKEWEKVTMRPLVKWFEQRGYFEALNAEFMEQVVDIRNRQSHPDRHNVSGFIIRQWIDHSRDCINGLYEDINLRKKRKSWVLKMNQWVTKHKTKEWLLYKNNKEYYLIQRPVFLFYDNKRQKYHYRFHVINDMFTKSEDRSTIGILSLTASGYEVNGEEMLLRVGDDLFTLTSHLHDRDREVFRICRQQLLDRSSQVYKDNVICELGIGDEFNSYFRPFLKL